MALLDPTHNIDCRAQSRLEFFASPAENPPSPPVGLEISGRRWHADRRVDLSAQAAAGHRVAPLIADADHALLAANLREKNGTSFNFSEFILAMALSMLYSFHSRIALTVLFQAINS